MPEEKTQSGKQVGWGIIGFIVGLIAILLIVKFVFGF
jgi:hypothetical protein